MARFKPAKWIDPKFGRHHCCVCFEDLNNKISIGGQVGNECAHCFCKRVTINEEDFLKIVENRHCYQCSWEYDRNLAIAEERKREIRGDDQRYWEYGRDLTIKPAIIQFENGMFRGLLCFRCRFALDKKDDSAKVSEFIASQQLHTKQCVEAQNRNEKRMADWRNQCDQLKAQLAHSLIRRVWSALTGTRNLPPAPENDPLPPAPQPLNRKALSGCPQLLFDFREEDLNPNFVDVQAEFIFDKKMELDGCSNQYANWGEPPDWNERSKRCKQRDGKCCILCSEKKNLAAHHVIPKSKRGSHSLQNLITLCQRCHFEQEYYGHKFLVELTHSSKY
jgi:hypothetical protein